MKLARATSWGHGLLAFGAMGTMIIGVAQPVATAFGSDKKTFTVDVDGSTPGAALGVYAGDADAAVVVVLTNTSPSQLLGSVNLVVPAPFVLGAAPDDTVPGGPVVELRNLAIPPGSSRSFTLSVDVAACTPPAPPQFSVTAKQANDYSGTGNDFTLEPSDRSVEVVGTCGLAFVDQPTNAELDVAITSAALDPTGLPVSVEVLDASLSSRATSSAATVTLSAANPSVAAPVVGGTTAAVAVAGLARFVPGPSLAPSAFEYTLSASSAGLVGSQPSLPFAIVDDGVSCPAGQPCDEVATVAKNGQSVSVSFGAGSTTSSLLVSLGSADAPSFTCAGYPRKAGVLVSQFVFAGDGDDRLGRMTTTVPDGSKPLNDYQVCWAAPYPFTTKAGVPAAVQGTKPGTNVPLYVGLLPDCPRRGTLRPCVSSRSQDRSTKAVTIVVVADGADPWRY